MINWIDEIPGSVEGTPVNRANLMDMLKHRGFDLILAGHMHGGQFRLPWGTGVCEPRSSWGSGGSLSPGASAPDWMRFSRSRYIW